MLALVFSPTCTSAFTTPAPPTTKTPAPPFTGATLYKTVAPFSVFSTILQFITGSLWNPAKASSAPGLTPLETDVWTADSVLQHIKSKRDIQDLPEEDYVPKLRTKRFFAPFLTAYLHGLARNVQIDRNVTARVNNQTQLSQESMENNLSHNETTTMAVNSTVSAPETRLNSLYKMMFWLRHPLAGAASLLIRPDQAPMEERVEENEEYFEEDEQDSFQDTSDTPVAKDYSLDIYLTILALGAIMISLIGCIFISRHYKKPQALIPIGSVPIKARDSNPSLNYWNSTFEIPLYP